jgi:hypothetical protein
MPVGQTSSGGAKADRDALNFFEPFERLPPNHENQLTRALLVILRLSPIAHEAWLARAASGRRLHELPAAEFHTQRRAVRTASGPDDQVPVVSIFLAPNEILTGDAVMIESDRRQVLDAVVEYGDALVVVIENKVAEASDEQARALNLTGAGVVIADGQERVVVTWPEVIGDITGIVERGLAGGAERMVLEDFVAYVEDHFPELGPYRTLGLCGGNAFRINRRLRALLGEASGREAKIDKWGPTVELPELPDTAARAYIFSTEANIEVSVYPADTLSQARAFYDKPEIVSAVRALAEGPDWSLYTNFHFGHMEGGYAWCSGPISTDRYLDLWQEKIGQTGALHRDSWDDYWDWLLQEDVASPDDRLEFDRHFAATQRQTATPRPGLKLIRRWPSAEATALDGGTLFGGEIASALDIAAYALSAPTQLAT